LYNQLDKLQTESLATKIAESTSEFDCLTIQILVKSSPKVMDIEDIVKEGKKSISCPYFSLRYLIEDADLVILPYQALNTYDILENSIIGMYYFNH